MHCPDENVLVGFAAGELDAATHAAVLRHIESCSDCAELSADAAVAVGEPGDTEPTRQVSPGPGAPPAMVGPLPRGTTLGRYVVLDLLGAGGLGQVYTAYDPELDRKVAVKLLRPTAAGPVDAEAQRWLMREAQAMAQLSHTNVVPVHDIGTFGDQVFIAMKLVGGGTLRDWLRRGKRSWKEIRDVLHGAGRGLAAAHAAGLVHRDFKPANLLVDEADCPYVVDFGLARAVAGPVERSPDADPLLRSHDALLGEDLTETGVIIGTPAYMAPEQISGRDVDPRADQFSFCVTLYEALYGVRPFTGKTYGELHRAIVIGARPPATKHPIPGPIPGWLRRALVRGLAADAASRFASMDALLSALTVDRRSRRRQRGFIAAAVVASAVVAGGLGFALQPEPTSSERDAIETVVVAARDAAAQAYFIYPPDDDPDFPTAYVRVLELEGTDGAPADVAHARAQVLRGEFATTLSRLGDSYWERRGGKPFASDYYAAAVMFDPTHEHAAARMHMTPGQLGALQKRAAELSFSDGELTAAQALIALAEPDEEARRAKVGAFAAKGVGPVATQTQLAQLYGEPEPGGPSGADSGAVAMEQPRPEPAPEPTSRRTRTGSRRAAKPEDPGAAGVTRASRDPDAARAEVALGKVALKKGQTEAASAHFHRALEHDAKSVGALAGLAKMHFELLEHSEALRFGERAVRLAPKRAGLRVELGDSYLNVLRYADARKQYEKALELGDRRAQGRLNVLAKKQGG
ncbi:MAG: protein kinase [Myxococcota bacterium]